MPLDTQKLKFLTGVIQRCSVNDPERSLVIGKEVLELCEKLKDRKFTSNIYHLLAISYRLTGDLHQAVVYNEKALALREQLNLRLDVARSLGNLGNVYIQLGQYPKGLEYHLRSLKIKEELNDKLGISKSLANIGSVYFDLPDYKKALDFQKRSLQLSAELGNKADIASTCAKIGNTYTQMNNYKEALEWEFKSLEIDKQLNNEMEIASTLINIGVTFWNMNENERAIEYEMKALEIYRNKNVTARVNPYTNLGGIYLSQKKFDQAEDYCRKAYAIAKEVHLSKTLKNICEYLSEIYLHKNEFEKSLIYYKESIALRDSMNNLDIQKQIIQQQTQADFARKATADSVRVANEKKVTDAQLKQERTQRYALYGGLGLVLLFAIVMFNRFKVTQRQKAIIEEQKHLVEEKQKEVMDSIHYAQRIQRALIASEKYITKTLDRLKD